ncbi:MAG: extracellular solute-binding protein, partial [Ignavibacteria bacterium]|nr:extracellular solute-binding protein [Ignavibacteria bacterium]
MKSLLLSRLKQLNQKKFFQIGFRNPWKSVSSAKSACYLLFLFSLLFLSCNQKKDSQTEISFWAMGAEGEFVQKLVPEFEKQNPGIKIKVQMVPWTAAQEKLVTAYASDNSPDVYQLGNTWVPQFSALGAIEELNPWIQKSIVVKREKYFEGIWDTNVLDNEVFGIPWYVDTRVMFYRTDVLAKAGYKSPP